MTEKKKKKKPLRAPRFPAEPPPKDGRTWPHLPLRLDALDDEGRCAVRLTSAGIGDRIGTIAKRTWSGARPDPWFISSIGAYESEMVDSQLTGSFTNAFPTQEKAAWVLWVMWETIEKNPLPEAVRAHLVGRGRTLTKELFELRSQASLKLCELCELSSLATRHGLELAGAEWTLPAQYNRFVQFLIAHPTIAKTLGPDLAKEFWSELRNLLKWADPTSQYALEDPFADSPKT